MGTSLKTQATAVWVTRDASISPRLISLSSNIFTSVLISPLRKQFYQQIGLLFPLTGQMGTYWGNIFRYFFYNQVNNAVGDKGCKYLSRTYWPHLKEIRLGTWYNWQRKQQAGREIDPIPLQGPLAQPLVFQFMSAWSYIEHNFVTNFGLVHLCMTHWPRLSKAYLSNIYSTKLVIAGKRRRRSARAG